MFSYGTFTPSIQCLVARFLRKVNRPKRTTSPELEHEVSSDGVAAQTIEA